MRMSADDLAPVQSVFEKVIVLERPGQDEC
jgi:hypothetical protein